MKDGAPKFDAEQIGRQDSSVRYVRALTNLGHVVTLDGDEFRQMANAFGVKVPTEIDSLLNDNYHHLGGSSSLRRVTRKGLRKLIEANLNGLQDLKSIQGKVSGSA